MTFAKAMSRRSNVQIYKFANIQNSI